MARPQAGAGDHCSKRRLIKAARGGLHQADRRKALAGIVGGARDVDPDLIRLAENMAGKIAKPILEARRALRG